MPDDSKKLSPRAREIAVMLSQVSNVTIPKRVRLDIADALQWELGIGEDAESAWNLAISCRLALGWSSNSREAWHQIVSKYQPLGVTPTRHDWLRVANFTLDDGSENLPDAKRSAAGIQQRVHELLERFCRAHDVPQVSRQAVVDERRPTTDADPELYERRYP